MRNYYKIKRPNEKTWKTPEDLRLAVVSYFEEVDGNGSMPTKEGLYLHLGVTDDTVLNYKEKYGEEYGQIIKKTYRAIADAWSQRLSGTVPTGAIFYLKAAFHWKDRIDHTSDDKPLEGNTIIFKNFKKGEIDVQENGAAS